MDRLMKACHLLNPDHLEYAPRPGQREICFPSAATGHQQRSLSREEKEAGQ